MSCTDDDAVHVGEGQVDHDQVDMAVAADQGEAGLGGRDRQRPAAERLDEDAGDHRAGAVAVDDRDARRAAVGGLQFGMGLAWHPGSPFQDETGNYPRPCLTTG